jgi:hypothetical protein
MPSSPIVRVTSMSVMLRAVADEVGYLLDGNSVVTHDRDERVA